MDSSPNTSPSLSIVIPCYNEEKRILSSLEQISRELASIQRSCEVVLVDDGSIDNTLAILTDFARHDQRLMVLAQNPNQGKGAAVRAGMLAARGRIRLYMDADLATPLSEMEKIIRPIEENRTDVVIGSRVVQESRITVAQPWIRSHLTGPAFRLAVRLIIGLKGLRDLQCGFKAFSAECAEAVFPLCAINRYAFDVEVLAAAQHRGYRVQEKGVLWEDKKGTKVNVFRDAPRMFLDLLRIRQRLRSQGIAQ